MTTRLVSVAVPVVVDRPFTYAVPREWSSVPAPGSRVLVPFGARWLVGVVRPSPVVEPPPPGCKTIAAALDDAGRPALGPELTELCEWLSDYYLVPIGEAYRVALPGLLTRTDARVVSLTEAGRQAIDAAAQGPLMAGHGQPLTTVERQVLHAIAESPQGLALAKLTRLRPRIAGAFAVVDGLENRGLCRIAWQDAAGDARPFQVHVRRTEYLRRAGADEDAVQNAVGRSKQRRALLDYLECQDGDGWVSLAELRGPFPRVRSLLPPLVAAKLVATEERLSDLDPFAVETDELATPQVPTPDQARALTDLRSDLEARTFTVSLLHGVTGSGKTEVYLQLIAQARAQGQGAIVLVPEIALTPQLAQRFRARFADEVAVLHSGLSATQRVEAWQQIRDGQRSVVIGARSAVFAPLPALGVVVVDEEHDPSFKQEEGVRYNARDVAMIRARSSGAVVVLGSATPSLETYEHARTGRYRWLQLSTRPRARPLPEVEVLSLAVHRPDPQSQVTAKLKQALVQVVDSGEQALLFLNRRGFTTALQCRACGNFHQCPDCSAPSMTYHLGRNRLMCHLCGHIDAPPRACSSCGAEDLVHEGVGTERLEVALSKEIPGIRILRLDRDAARGRRLLDTLARFRAGEADVLVGTQMLSKGHDFPGVTLVGILRADQGLALPDPRAAERTFQLLTQVSGRAGRGDRPGRVLIQAYAIDHPAIVHAAQHDFASFSAAELERRREVGNPPFGHLALIRVSGVRPAEVQARAMDLARFVQEVVTGARVDPEVEVLGPAPAPIARINRRHRWHVLLRAPRRPGLRWALQALRPRLGIVGHGDAHTLAVVDVDPQTML